MEQQTENQSNEQQLNGDGSPQPIVAPRQSVQSPATAQLTSTKVRLLTLALLAGLIFFPLPFIWVALWIVLTKHYQLSVILRVFILLMCGFVGPIIAVFGAIAGIDTYGSNYPVLFLGVAITLAPFLFSLIKPLKVH